MPRKSKWDGNDEMWEWAAALHRGGVSYADIQARLSTTEKVRFALEEVPSPDTVRYQINRRSLLTNSESSPLPSEELAEHRKGLSFLGVLLREGVQEPPGVLYSSLEELLHGASGRFWGGGFNFEAPESVIPGSDVEREMKDEWDSWVQIMPSYKYFEQHLRSTKDGRRMIRDLNRVHRLAARHDTAVNWIVSWVNSAKRKLAAYEEDESSIIIASALGLSSVNDQLKIKHISDVAGKVRRPPKELTGLVKTLSKSDEYRYLRVDSHDHGPILVLRDSLRPTALVRRLVQDGYCDICR